MRKSMRYKETGLLLLFALCIFMVACAVETPAGTTPETNSSSDGHDTDSSGSTSGESHPESGSGETGESGGSSAGNSGTGNSGAVPVITNSGYVVFAWNDLGMHCLNPTYDQAVILPPYNTLVAQVVRKGSPPEIVTSGLSVEYRIIGNTWSYGKTDSFGAAFGQFWDNALALFGIALEKNKGINLSDSGVHNGLSGQMLPKGDYFTVNGIPVTPVNDSGAWNPYQTAEITVKNTAGAIVAQTRATVPVSDEINCANCHGADAFADILQKHDLMHGTALVSGKPVLCANCHGSPALGKSGAGPTGKYLSYAIHNSHAARSAACYDCHPGTNTKCNRSAAHTSSDGNCVACHGTMAELAGSIASGARIPWAGEPKCFTCHNVSGVDTGSVLYKDARGHGNLFCAGCHGSPHAMVPATQESDNYQAIQYQGKAKSIGSCGACHSGSRGDDDMSEFAEEHGGANPENRNACHICHTSVSTDTAKWPHAFGWKNR